MPPLAGVPRTMSPRESMPPPVTYVAPAWSEGLAMVELLFWLFSHSSRFWQSLFTCPGASQKWQIGTLPQRAGVLLGAKTGNVSKLTARKAKDRPRVVRIRRRSRDSRHIVDNRLVCTAETTDVLDVVTDGVLLGCNSCALHGHTGWGVQRRIVQTRIRSFPSLATV